MKKANIKLLLAALMICSFALLASAQDGRTRVRFAKGKTSAELSRTVSGDSGVITFMVHARKGQRMHFTVESDAGVSIDFSEAGKQDFTFRSEPNEPNEFIVKKTGDHFITVVNPTDGFAQITLRISIK